ncbi:MAG: hypothetical protein H6825_00835 [Planctomycetes bacterium]|nr:hypothetical protein [Planctomycetota bacterium]
MIKVTCEACGKSFGAKDELAGRKGKCPSCGAPIVVGSAAPAAATPAARPAAAAGQGAAPVRAAPAPSVTPSSGGSRGWSSRGGGSRRGGGSSKGGKDYTSITALALVVAIGVAVAGWFLSQDEGPNPYFLGTEAKEKGHLEEALAWFEKVPADDPSYERAKGDIVAVRDMIAAQAANDARAHGDAAYQYVIDLEERFVDRNGQGYLMPTYVPNARYMLKRAKEFLDSYPNDPRRGEIEKLMWKYSEVASLDKPPTVADVRAELGFRGGATRSWDLRAMEQAVEEFVSRNPGDEAGARELWAYLDERNHEFWTRTYDRSSKWIEQGNWKALLDDIATYKLCYEGTQRLKPDPEALKLEAEAKAKAASAGG